MPKEMADKVNSALTLRENRRKEVIEHIQANTEEGTWTNDELSAMSCNILEKLTKSINAGMVDYSGADAGNISVNKGDAKVKPLISNA